jgi:hypothetical protein
MEAEDSITFPRRHEQGKVSADPQHIHRGAPVPTHSMIRGKPRLENKIKII